jgi:glutathione synthase/RimK-type ligase-like ATP-grasp enzyme
MHRILLSEAGGTLTRNVVMSLAAARRRYYLIGVSSNRYELAMAGTDEAQLVPRADAPEFIPVLAGIIRDTKPDILHSQHDSVIKVLSHHRRELLVPMFLPPTETIDACVDKYESYRLWQKAGVPVPDTVEVRSPEDLRTAFEQLGPELWIRLKEGGGGAGALRVRDPEFARIWIDHFEGWGRFTAARTLGNESVTWSSIWHNGRLVVAQSRKRLNWLFANRTLSGVTGVTGVGLTIRDEKIDELALKAIRAIDPAPHGIFSVDMTYGQDGGLYLTEINIGRFFTTIQFFTAAGVNFPDIFFSLALGGKPPHLARKVNPLRPGLLWIRGMDTAPVLTDVKMIGRLDSALAKRIKRLA